jgi:hypothetical protein
LKERETDNVKDKYLESNETERKLQDEDKTMWISH